MKKIIAVLMLFASTYVFADQATYASWLESRCNKFDVPLDIATAVAMVESNFTMVTSHRNSNGSYDVGIFQLNSHYHSWFEETLWYASQDFDPYDPQDNIEMGVIYLRYLRKHAGDWEEAIKAYNTGLTGRAVNPDQAWDYFVKVVNVLNEIKETL